MSAHLIPQSDNNPMRPIDFPETNTIIAENQPPYIPLPALYLPDNMGTVKNRPVVHDYGNHNVFGVAQKAHKLVKGNRHDGFLKP